MSKSPKTPDARVTWPSPSDPHSVTQSEHPPPTDTSHIVRQPGDPANTVTVQGGSSLPLSAPQGNAPQNPPPAVPALVSQPEPGEPQKGHAAPDHPKEVLKEPAKPTPPTVSTGTQTSPIAEASPQAVEGKPATAEQPPGAPQLPIPPTVPRPGLRLPNFTDDEILKLCHEVGILRDQQVRPLNGDFTSSPDTTYLRQQLEDFQAFTNFTSDHLHRKPLRFEDGLSKNDFFELWISQEVVHMKQEGKNYEHDVQTAYRWVFFRDGAGVVRSRVPIHGTQMTETVRTIRWPTKWQKFQALSCQGRRAHKPWEEHLFINLLKLPIELPHAGDKLARPTWPDYLGKSTSSAVLNGSMENFFCTILRVETVHALLAWCQRDYGTFLAHLHKHKTLITADISRNLNRGPIFNAAMVNIALGKVVNACLQEYIPQRTMAYARDIMYHYLANRDLHIETRFVLGPRWTPRPFDTSDFNAASHIYDEFHRRFFKEVQEIIRQGYGTTVEERIKSGAAVCAVVYTACLMAMDVADDDNALYAQNLIRAVGVAFDAINALLMASNLPQSSIVTTYLLMPIAAIIKDKINGKYERGALKKAVVKWFRNMYVVGAVRGERVSGFRFRREDEIGAVAAEDREQFLEMMARRRTLGKKFEAMTRMYVNALGEEWPHISFVDEETYESLSVHKTEKD